MDAAQPHCAFPKETVTIDELTRQGRIAEAIGSNDGCRAPRMPPVGMSAPRWFRW
jgi:hypothetical protein